MLVAGCGYVGSALAALLAARGQRVFGLRRDPAGLPAGVQPLAADLSDPATLSGLPADLDCVFYTASPREGGEPAYRAAYLDGPRHLLEALARAGPPRRAILTSSTAVYAQRAGEWVDEGSPAEASHPEGRILLAGEARWLAAPLETSVVRLGGIYGPGRARLLESVRDGSARLPAAARWTNRIHRDDCAGALAHLFAQPRIERLYLGVDCEPADLRDVMRWLAQRLGVPEPEVGMPEERRARGQRRCRNDRLRAAGYAFRFPTFREGYAPLVEALRARRA